MKGQTAHTTSTYFSMTSYNTAEEERGLTIEQRKKAYEALSVERLTIRVNGYVGQTYYLRPSVKSLQLDFCISVSQIRRKKHLEFLHGSAYREWFQAIEAFLEATPESQLEEFHIQFVPLVSLYMIDEDHILVGYDKYGPLYEDDDWLVKTEKNNPSDYLFYLTKESRLELDQIGDALLQLLEKRPWKAITLPYHFPSAALVAEKYPFATFTDEVNEDESIERVYQTLEEEYDLYIKN